jgi:hypothetical protein
VVLELLVVKVVLLESHPLARGLSTQEPSPGIPFFFFQTQALQFLELDSVGGHSDFFPFTCGFIVASLSLTQLANLVFCFSFQNIAVPVDSAVVGKLVHTIFG